MKLNLTKNQWKIIFVVIVGLGIWLLGFYLGRKTVKPKETIKTVTEYVKGKTVRDTIKSVVPYKVVEPVDTLDIIKQCIKDGIYSELWPTRVEYIEPTKSDSTAIMKDWATKRYYSETLFDSDTLGKCSVNAEIQYNRMSVMSYEYSPMTKATTTTITQKVIPLFSPFVGVGGFVNPWDEKIDPLANIGAGFYIKEKYGLELQYMHSFQTKNDYVGGQILMKF